MKLKNLTLEIAVVLACYLVITMPMASATSVNIIFNGQTMESVEYEPSNIVNQHITYVRDPRDIAWSNVRVAITLNSASLAHTIKRVYLYKCGALTPVSCLQKTPESFDTYVDTEIAWNDIAQSTGQARYPQEGNLLFLVKLEDPDGLTSWVGLWNTIRRSSHREFFFYRHELSDVDVHAESSSLVGPIATYIQNFNTIPFRWLTKASFGDALSISAIGGDDRELDTSPPALQSVEPPGSEITVINKENYFVFPETSSGFAFPITLEQNPDFQCGDGRCESSLGESQETCCYDCGCPDGYYCDTPAGSPEQGTCKNEALIDLDVVGTPSAEVSDCSHSLELGITARLNNPPAGLEENLNAVVKVADSAHAAQCTQSSPGLYDCRFSMIPTIQCGSGARQAGPNELKLTVTYNDGINAITRDLTESFPAISLNYDCSCPDGYYCDTGTESCQSEEAITLGITELTSYLDDYTPGDTIDLTAKLFNPPTGTVLVSASAGLNLTNGMVSPGTPQCTGPSEDYEYECSIPFSITGYQKETNYRFFPNFLSFQITYNDGASAKTKALTTEFGPMSIPSQNCGNGVCNTDESPENCCADCGCPQAGDYCDRARGCSSLGSITLTAIPYPRELEDCKMPNEVNLKATVDNAPYGITLDYSSLTVNYQPVPWKFECPRLGEVGGVFNCMFEIPPTDGCELPYYTVGPNRLTFTVSFPNGLDDQNRLVKELNTSFDNIYITPIPHIDGECESGLGENGSTACLDCPCAEDPALGEGYYCDAGPDHPKGTCLPRSGVTLVVESPTEPVWFSSCEELNKVSVLMHVRNQPSGMEIENVYASLGGEAARYVHCSQSGGTYLDSNLTLNCSIGIPPIDACTQGMTYNYTNNSISLIISYDNGQQRKVLQTLTADLPEFYIHQTIRTLYDITQEAQRQMRAVLDNIMALTEKTMDIIEKCIKMQMIMFIMSLVMSLAMGYAGGSAAKAQGESFWQGFGQGMETGGKIGEKFSDMIGDWCENLQKINEIEIKLQKMQMKKIAMEMCLAISQHHLDSGDCRGREEACFENILSCLSYLDDMEDIMEDIGRDFKQINRNFADMNQAVAEIGEAWGDFADGGVSRNQYFSVEVGGEPLSDNYVICDYSGVEVFNEDGTPRRCRFTAGNSRGDGYVYIGLSENDCRRNYAVVTVNDRIVARVNVGEDGVSKKERVEGLLKKLEAGQMNEIELYCTDETETVGNLRSSTGYSQLGPSIRVARGATIESECTCTYDGEKFRGVKRITSSSDGTNGDGSKLSSGEYPIAAIANFNGFTQSEFDEHKKGSLATPTDVTLDPGKNLPLIAFEGPYCDPSEGGYGYGIWVKVRGNSDVARAKMHKQELWTYIGNDWDCEDSLKEALESHAEEGKFELEFSGQKKLKYVIVSSGEKEAAEAIAVDEVNELFSNVGKSVRGVECSEAYEYGEMTGVVLTPTLRHENIDMDSLISKCSSRTRFVGCFSEAVPCDNSKNYEFCGDLSKATGGADCRCDYESGPFDHCGCTIRMIFDCDEVSALA